MAIAVVGRLAAHRLLPHVHELGEWTEGAVIGEVLLSLIAEACFLLRLLGSRCHFIWHVTLSTVPPPYRSLVDGGRELLFRLGALWAGQGLGRKPVAGGILRGGGLVGRPAVKQSLSPVAGLNVHF